ncbi:MAG: DUF1846 domain-containing protein [Bacillota bacterium]
MRTGFDLEKYLNAQTRAISERVDALGGKLYLEFGGKLVYDFHAARVLPGYDPSAKLSILKRLKPQLDLLFCVSAKDIQKGRIWGDYGLTYDNATLKTLDDLNEHGLEVRAVVISRYSGEEQANRFKVYLEKNGVRVYLQPELPDYPRDVDGIVSEKGYGSYPHIETERPLVVVTGAGPGSGKMGTCLAQIYHDHQAGIPSGFAKFETFPIWSLPISHPVNLAYEAATADLGDLNVVDPFHLEAYKVAAVNYNRDVENFRIMKRVLDRIAAGPGYLSPTDMGVNMAHHGIVDDEVVRQAGRQEIIRRYFRYHWETLRRVERPETLDRVKKIMWEHGIDILERRVVAPARKVAVEAERAGKGNQGVFCGAAIELEDGTIVTGKNSPLLHAEAAMILNAVKLLADIPDAIHLLAPSVIASIHQLKTQNLQGRSPSLNLSETLIALAISCATNPTAQAALDRLHKLRGCQMHTTHAPSRGDEEALRKLGVLVTTDARPAQHQFLVR